MVLVHAADLHLATVFPHARGGAARRAALDAALARIVDLAIARGADALTLGGDVYEAGRAGPATARYLFAELARFGRPVFVAPGNHDPYGARSLLARDDRPANVRVFAESAWEAVPLGHDVTLYGFGHTPAEPGRPFAGVRFDRDGARIALVHGSDEDRCPPGKRATAPFTADDVVASGATLALCGHYHGGYVEARDGRPVLAYPGSPEPIKAGERGEHGALVVTIEAGVASVEPVALARTRVVELDVRVDGASSEPVLLDALARALDGYGADDHLRARLHGTIERGVRVDRALLAERAGAGLGSLDVEDRTAGADSAAIAREPTVRGRAVADLLAAAQQGDDDAERALRLVIAAFEAVEIAP